MLCSVELRASGSDHVGFTHRGVRSPRLFVRSYIVPRVYEGKRITFIAEQGGIYESEANSGYWLRSIRGPILDPCGHRFRQETKLDPRTTALTVVLSSTECT